MHKAIEIVDEEKIDILLAKNAKLNLKNEAGGTAIDWMSERARVDKGTSYEDESNAIFEKLERCKDNADIDSLIAGRQAQDKSQGKGRAQ